MSGFMQKFKGILGMDEDDEEEYEDEIEEEVTSVKKIESKNSFIIPKPEGTELKFPASQAQVSRAVLGNSAPLKMIVVEPKRFEDTQRLVDSLKARKPVIVNLTNIENEPAHKIFDFLNGAVYALGGSVQKIAPNIFVFTPENVDIATNIESGSMDFTDAGTKGNWS